MITYETNYLAHHGILGMKWGIRRYQRKDGTRTALGKKREKQLRNAAIGAAGAAVAAAGTTAAAAMATKKHVQASHTNNNNRKTSKMLERTEKGGKGKPNKSPAQVTSEEAEKVIKNSTDILRIAKQYRKKPESKAKTMSDAELRRIINRLDMERRYDQLTETKSGYDYAIDALQVFGSIVAIGTSGIVIYSMLKNM